jgi:hypothetical protein|tara:strand:+ start:158 stop:877 length:720 start_codon:yes stop_codon:yes gene_type:complete
MNENDALNTIRNAIKSHGHFVHTISGGSSPRFLYTIGLHEKLGVELLFAGGAYFSAQLAKEIVDCAAKYLMNNPSASTFNVENINGNFELKKADESWSNNLPLGAIDYYKADKICLMQITPPKQLMTIDVPNCDLSMNDINNRVWSWFNRSYPSGLPKSCSAVTNLDALKGAAVTEVMRWEVDQWELFSGAGPDVKKEDARVVPLSTLVLYDPTLDPVMKLKEGKGLWRNEDMMWNNWN